MWCVGCGFTKGSHPQQPRNRNNRPPPISSENQSQTTRHDTTVGHAPCWRGGRRRRRRSSGSWSGFASRPTPPGRRPVVVWVVGGGMRVVVERSGSVVCFVLFCWGGCVERWPPPSLSLSPPHTPHTTITKHKHTPPIPIRLPPPGWPAWRWAPGRNAPAPQSSSRPPPPPPPAFGGPPFVFVGIG